MKIKIAIILIALCGQAQATVVTARELSAKVRLIQAYRLTKRIPDRKVRNTMRRYIRESYFDTNNETIPRDIKVIDIK